MKGSGGRRKKTTPLTKTMAYNKNEMKKKILESPAQTKWEKGVKQYALELATEAEEKEYLSEEEFEKALLNGAQDWRQYSYGGCSLINDDEIFCRLFTQTTLRKWLIKGKLGALDLQAQALKEACNLVMKLAKKGVSSKNAVSF